MDVGFAFLSLSVTTIITIIITTTSYLASKHHMLPLPTLSLLSRPTCNQNSCLISLRLSFGFKDFTNLNVIAFLSGERKGREGIMRNL